MTGTLTLGLAALGLGLPAPDHPVSGPGLTGRVVMACAPPQIGPPPFFLAEDAQTPDHPQQDTLKGIDYRVLRDPGGPRLMVGERGRDVWVPREHLLPPGEAVGVFTARLRNSPNDPTTLGLRAWANKLNGDLTAAVSDYDQALRINPNLPGWHNNRGLVHMERKDLDAALTDFEAALAKDPANTFALRSRAALRLRQKKWAEAARDFEEAIRVEKAVPPPPQPYAQLARLLASCPDAQVRDGKRAVELAAKANELTKWRAAYYLDALAAAHAEAGDFREAVEYAEKALNANDLSPGDRRKYRDALKLYRDGKPRHDKEEPEPAKKE